MKNTTLTKFGRTTGRFSTVRWAIKTDGNGHTMSEPRETCNADVYLECMESINRAAAHYALMKHCSSFKTWERIKDEARNR